MIIIVIILQVNPPNYIPLVEIVPAPYTDSAVVEKTVSLMKDIGQSPVVVKKEVNGFILNRLQYAIIMEAWRLVEASQFVLRSMGFLFSVK
jgi:L-gulonate 3-dehydrogenase